MEAGWEKIIAAVGTALAAVLAPIGVIYAAHTTRQGKAAEATVDDLKKQIAELQADYDREKESGKRWFQEVVRLNSDLRHERTNRMQERNALIRQGLASPDMFAELEPLEQLQQIIDRSSGTLPKE